MRNVRLVIRHEVSVVLGSRWFWAMTIAFPILLVALTALPEAASRRAFRAEVAGGAGQAAGAASVIAYVDPAGLIAALPPDGDAARLRAYPDEEAARAALAAGEITEYHRVPPDYLATGRIELVAETISPLVNLGGVALLERALTYNLVGDASTAALLEQPIRRLEERPLRPAARRPEPPEDIMAAMGLPFGVMFILFFVLTASAGFMLQSVGKEKQDRTAEVLLVSVRPRELMLGKLVGLGFVALVQMAFWLGGVLLTGRGQEFVTATRGQPLTPALVAWAAAYFLLGYVLYASALGALGALAPGLREGSQLTFVLLVPLMLPMVLSFVFMRAPGGPLATALSLFPLTAPTSMVTRLVVSEVPSWQPAAGLLGLALTAYLFVLIAAHFFRAETLLSTSPLRWPRRT